MSPVIKNKYYKQNWTIFHLIFSSHKSPEEWILWVLMFLFKWMKKICHANKKILLFEQFSNFFRRLELRLSFPLVDTRLTYVWRFVVCSCLTLRVASLNWNGLKCLFLYNTWKWKTKIKAPFKWIEVVNPNKGFLNLQFLQKNKLP